MIHEGVPPKFIQSDWHIDNTLPPAATLPLASVSFFFCRFSLVGIMVTHHVLNIPVALVACNSLYVCGGFNLAALPSSVYVFMVSVHHLCLLSFHLCTPQTSLL